MFYFFLAYSAMWGMLATATDCPWFVMPQCASMLAALIVFYVCR